MDGTLKRRAEGPDWPFDFSDLDDWEKMVEEALKEQKRLEAEETERETQEAAEERAGHRGQRRLHRRGEGGLYRLLSPIPGNK